MRKIAVLGVGLIGGSLGLALHRGRRDLAVAGYDREEVLATALRIGAITEAAPSAAIAVSGADIVVLAVPTAAIPALLAEVSAHLEPGAIVTDVASVKAPIAAAAKALLPSHVRFIPGHPMAGAEQGGIEHAYTLLFENATWVLCPERSDERMLAEHCASLIDLLKLTGARILLLDPDRHDRIAAAVSHLPQLLAVALMNHAAGLNAGDDAVLKLAAGGFRDMTRIASSPFNIWRDILEANREQVLAALDGLGERLSDLRTLLATERYDDAGQAFEQARRMRNTIPKNSKGFLNPLADLFVYAEDQPGVLNAITSVLFGADINIKDIELLKIREGEGGAFRLSVSDDAVAERAVTVLRSSGFTAYRS